MLVVFVVATAVLEEEHVACLDQQHSGNEGQAVVVVEDLSISDLDDSSNLDCIYCLKGHNYFSVVGFAAESSPKWPLSKMLDMLQTLRGLIPEFQSLFPESMVKEVMTVHHKLGETCRVIFMKMEDNIFCNPSVKIICSARCH